MDSFIWAAAGLVAWFTGSTVLQTRAKNKPFDIATGVAILALTVISFHFEASVMLASPAQYLESIIATFLDVVLLLAAIFVLKKRVSPNTSYFALAILVTLGSMAFWFWYIGWLGGLAPR
jgi:mannose/fructose/N-acetylgalactosamine-specific phosphotransferase system component IID